MRLDFDWRRHLITVGKPGVCVFCNSGFVGRSKLYCSTACYWKSKSKGRNISYGNRTCKGCDVSFEAKASRHYFCDECKESPIPTWIARYKITGQQIRELFEKRDGLCFLCDNVAKYIDHNHQTGKVRGVLCPHCNTALGRVDVPGWLEKTNKYLSGEINGS
jgi:hypothetical protein